MKWKEVWREGAVDREGNEKMSDFPRGSVIICECVCASVKVASQNLGVIPSAAFSYIPEYFLGLVQVFPSSAEEAIYQTRL